ncbi:alpha/beta hydrolase [Pseudoduganella umbonata]|uniref:Alpha/beta hydrolase n=1 Tax=Pseudoduganella umbonata TaxID=864828 RepID=A0A4P8HN95_9BURK|nr:alpha/beta hydrolase [Pseudoduganella umbonata]MBB3219728.1 esterase/lipase superfamily enzyme [Pseudoduganella umbonata]QCP09775.1 alpha/beta hydrolase [Pseudoduganella umbonata]
MDVITTALTGAIADGGTDVAYTMLKSRLTGKSPRVDEAITDLEQDPGSLSRQFAVSDALAAAGLAGDRYLRAAARNLVEEVERRRALRPAVPADQSGVVLQVFFATDRQPTGDRHPARQFGAARGGLNYGSCEVAIERTGPDDEAVLPTQLRRQSRPDADGHAVLLRAEVQSAQPFFPALAEAIARSGNSALLFVHGYRVSFEDAARRTAQIASDLRFAGVPVFYSWPSQGRLSGYTVDEANVEWALPRLAAFLTDLVQQTPVRHLHLLGHGMGARALTRAVAAAAGARPDLGPRLREIILAAPDIEAQAFSRDLAPALAATGGRITLYASSGDEALRVAQRTHPYPRAGDSGDTLVVAPGVDTIDASAVDTSLIRVSHDAPRPSALADMRQLIAGQLPPSHRAGLRAVDAPTGRYWTFNQREVS